RRAPLPGPRAAHGRHARAPRRRPAPLCRGHGLMLTPPSPYRRRGQGASMNAMETTRPDFLAIPRPGTVEAEEELRLWRRLTPVERALLAPDGSFTLLLRALSGEDVAVRVLFQTVTPGRPRSDLALSAGDRVLQRTVLLRTR